MNDANETIRRLRPLLEKRSVFAGGEITNLLLKTNPTELVRSYLVEHTKDWPTSDSITLRTLLNRPWFLSYVSAGVELAYCPAGSFLMGAAEDEEGAVFENETPQTEVYLSRAFWMMQMPVTQQLWTTIMGNNPSYHRKNSLQKPVEKVSFFDAIAFANALSKHCGYEPVYSYRKEEGTPGENTFRFSHRTLKVKEDATGFRLPTEAEWEYACRAETTKPCYGKLSEIAWTSENSGGQTQPVRQLRANRWNLYDMLGNVWEWCFDTYAPYEGSEVVDRCLNDGVMRVQRGGSWYPYDKAGTTRAAMRTKEPMNNVNFMTGFRLLRYVTS